MRSTLSAAGLAAALLLACTGASGFGNLGHETVGAMADQLLHGTHAQARVKALLTGRETLSSVATWADGAKGCCGTITAEQQAFVTANPKHHDYHYADVPFQHVGYDGSPVGTGPDDIVHVLQECIAVLKDPAAPSPHHFTQRQALLLTVHLAGDIHQPLHVGTAYVDGHHDFVVPSADDLATSRAFATQGDNFLVHGLQNIHSYWDTEVVMAAMRHEGATNPRAFATRLIAVKVAPPVTGGAPQTWPKQWADQSLVLSKVVHENMTLTDSFRQNDRGREHPAWHVEWTATYPKSAVDSGEQAVALAGFRLAQLLQATWP
jgi:hypothetical protein